MIILHYECYSILSDQEQRKSDQTWSAPDSTWCRKLQLQTQESRRLRLVSHAPGLAAMHLGLAVRSWYSMTCGGPSSVEGCSRLPRWHLWCSIPDWVHFSADVVFSTEISGFFVLRKLCCSLACSFSKTDPVGSCIRCDSCFLPSRRICCCCFVTFSNRCCLLMKPFSLHDNTFGKLALELGTNLVWNPHQSVEWIVEHCDRLSFEEFWARFPARANTQNYTLKWREIDAH